MRPKTTRAYPAKELFQVNGPKITRTTTLQVSANLLVVANIVNDRFGC